MSPLATTAMASEGDSSALNANDKTQMQSFWDVNDVSPSIQQELLEEIENGTWPQADTGVAESVDKRTVRRNGNVETIETYPDGSISVSALQVEGGDFNPKSFGVEDTAELNEVYDAAPSSIKNCTAQSGSGFRNLLDCTVFGSTATVGAGFIASYSIVEGANNDRIIRHSGPFQQCAGAQCDAPYVGLEYLNERSGRKAEVDYFFRWTAPGTSATGSVRLVVGNNAATSGFTAKL